MNFIKIRKRIEKKIRPTSFLGFFIYNIYYNLFSFHKQIYFFYPRKNHYIGRLFVFKDRNYKFYLKSKSAIVFIYECYIKHLYDKFLKIREGNIIIDCGANAGLFSIYASNKVGEKGKIISIEPEDKNFNNLKKNIKSNNIKNVIPINKGVYNKKTELNFYLSKEDFCHSLKNKNRNVSVKKIEVDTVENILNKLKISFDKVDFIKLDVEDSEFQALEGMKNILKKKRLKIIIPDIKYQDKDYFKIEKIIKNNDFKIKKEFLPKIHAIKGVN